MTNISYKTKKGVYYTGIAEKILTSKVFKKYENKIQLIITSPPFPLNNKKKYGNLTGDEYKRWLANFAEIFAKLLKDDGSIVIELGNAWVANRPVQSLLPMESLISFVKNKKAGLRLIQEFTCYNPARLPSPVQWVNIERIRTSDSYTHLWWMAKTDYPKADNRKILRPYSESMKMLLKKKKYNAGLRPSGHRIGKKSFMANCSGSIMHNFIEIESLDKKREIRLPNAFSHANTSSMDHFTKKCREKGVKPHPARMPIGLVNFFIKFLTDKGDIVLDPFAGSNTTGFSAETLGRKWISIDPVNEYVEQSMLRFNGSMVGNKKRRKNGSKKNDK